MIVYIAAAVADRERAERAAVLLRERGILVSSTWMDAVRAAPDVTDADMTDELAGTLANRCLDEIDAADVLWLLFPSNGAGRGAFVEYGYAIRAGKGLVVSGPELAKSIFSRRAPMCETDEEAAMHLGNVAADMDVA